MNVNTTDREQRELFQKWWKSQGKWLLVAVALGAALGLGWQRWQQYRQEQTIAASTIYQSMRAAETRKQVNVVKVYEAQLKKHYANTPYASFVAFFEAKDALAKGEYRQAEQALLWVIQHARVSALKQVARIRVARIYTQQKQFKSALAVLSKVDSQEYLPMVEQTRASIYGAQGDTQAAKKAFRAAKKGYAAQGIENPLVDMAMSL